MTPRGAASTESTLPHRPASCCSNNSLRLSSNLETVRCGPFGCILLRSERAGFSVLVVERRLWLAVTNSNLLRISELILSFPTLLGLLAECKSKFDLTMLFLFLSAISLLLLRLLVLLLFRGGSRLVGLLSISNSSHSTPSPFSLVSRLDFWGETFLCCCRNLK